jgi:hypothetical protein
MIPTPPWKRKRQVKRLIGAIDADIFDMTITINSIPRGNPKRKQLLDRIAEKTVALGLLQDELRTHTK